MQHRNMFVLKTVIRSLTVRITLENIDSITKEVTSAQTDEPVSAALDYFFALDAKLVLKKPWLPRLSTHVLMYSEGR